MSCARHLVVLGMLGAIGVFPTIVLHANLQGPADPGVPTAIEEALIEHACGGLRPAGALETDVYLECRNKQLLYLREEFGRDLKRLSNGDRRTIDAACSKLRGSQGQDVYIQCLTTQLAALRDRAHRSAPAGAETAAAPAPLAAAPPAPASSRSVIWIGAGVAALLAAAGGVFFARKSRQATGTCRTCGATLSERGDLCHQCRHEAADALRRATAERAEQARAEEERRRLAERAEEQRRLQARADEERRRVEEAHAEEARREEERRREEEARKQRQTHGAAAADEFDPWTVLGVSREATPADLEAAYQTARAKYDPELVAGLGPELQEHFRKKGLAVEQAYTMLAPRPPQSTD